MAAVFNKQIVCGLQQQVYGANAHSYSSSTA